MWYNREEMDKKEETRHRFIETVTNFGRKFGLNHALPQIYALLYWEGEPLSLEKISKELGMSKGNVSINIRKLEEWGAVRKVWKKGSNRHYYVANTNLTQFLPQRIKDTLIKRVEILKNHLDSLSKEIKEQDKKEKIEEIQNLSSQIVEFATHLLNSKLTDLIQILESREK